MTQTTGVVAPGMVLTTPRAHPDPSFTSDVRSTLNDPLVPDVLVGHPLGRLQRIRAEISTHQNPIYCSAAAGFIRFHLTLYHSSITEASGESHLVGGVEVMD